MQGLICGFPSCLSFVEGKKNKRWRIKDQNMQERAYDGYKKTHCLSVLVYLCLFVRFITIDISDEGSESDKCVYSNFPIYQNRDLYLTDGQHSVADMGFAVEGDLVMAYRRNESTEWMYRGSTIVILGNTAW